MAEQYIEAYRRYCWTVHSLADLKLAPFHLLASERVSSRGQRPRVAHDDAGSPLRRRSRTSSCNTIRIVDLRDEASQKEAIAWWEELTALEERGWL